jgi:hypothetical protein
LIAMSVPPGSTLTAEPMGATGQQVQELWATAGVTLGRDVLAGGIQVFLGTAGARCLGAGHFGVDFHANTETVVSSASVSDAETGPPPVCPLPYATTRVEVLVFDSAGAQLLSAEFPATYSFVAP